MNSLLTRVENKMKSTYQGKQTIWEHGESVRDHLFDLLDHLR
jgi:hypothetical protein